MVRKYRWGDIGKLPESPGVYMFGCGNDVYIGSSGNVKQRLNQHKNSGVDACFIKAIPTRTRKQAYDLERSLIDQNCPSQNKRKPSRCKTSLWDQLFG